MKKITLKNLIVTSCLIFVLLCTGCSQILNVYREVASESGHVFLTSEEDILEIISQTMRLNEQNCKFSVVSDDLIDMDAWLEKIDGLKNISVEYVETIGGWDVDATIKYWDCDPLLEAYTSGDTTKLSQEQITLLEKYKQILSECITDTMTPYEKELAIHDYLVNYLQYDLDNADISHTAYGALTNGVAVCDGYSECFQTLMRMVGIECILATGEADDIPHSWNMVKLDDEWYHVDVTWDDPVSETPQLSHQYLNVNDAILSNDHVWETETKATGTQYDYYNQTELTHVDTQSALNSYIKDCLTSQMPHITVVASSPLDVDAALKNAGIKLSYLKLEIRRIDYVVYELDIIY